MKRSLLYLLLIVLTTGQQVYAKMTIPTGGDQAVHQINTGGTFLDTDIFLPCADEEVSTNPAEISVQTHVAKKINGCAVASLRADQLKAEFFHRTAIPLLLHSTSRYLDFIFPFYCFW